MLTCTVFPTESEQSSWGAIERAHLRLPPTKPANSQFSAELTWMGIKCDQAALLGLQILLYRYAQILKVNKSFCGVVRLLLLYYRRIFNHVSFWEKVPVHHMTIDCITWPQQKLASRPAIFVGT